MSKDDKKTKLRKHNEINGEDFEAEEATEVSQQSSELYDPEIYHSIPSQSIESKVAVFKSHLYKLMDAKTIKNTGIYEEIYDTEDPDVGAKFDHVTHSHYVRTRDSDGRVPMALQKPTHPNGTVLRSTPIAGHFHFIEIVPHDDPNQPPRIVRVSEPVTIGSVKKGKRMVVAEIPLNDYDKHKHKIEYKRTQPVQARTKNSEANKVVAFEMQKEVPALNNNEVKA